MLYLDLKCSYIPLKFNKFHFYDKVIVLLMMWLVYFRTIMRRFLRQNSALFIVLQQSLAVAKPRN